MSAEESPEIVQELIDKEVASGWVNQFPGTLEEAQSFFESDLATGKLGLALSDSRPPRLVLDSTICGVNPQCVMPERTALPTIRDVVRSHCVVSPVSWPEYHLMSVVLTNRLRSIASTMGTFVSNINPRSN